MMAHSLEYLNRKDLAAIFSSDFERALNAYFKEQGAGAFRRDSKVH